MIDSFGVDEYCVLLIVQSNLNYRLKARSTEVTCV